MGTDYISASEQFTFDSSASTTQVCLSIATLEDELIEDSETIVIAATGIHGISVSGSPVTLEVHSRECEPITTRVKLCFGAQPQSYMLLNIDALKADFTIHIYSNSPVFNIAYCV